MIDKRFSRRMIQVKSTKDSQSRNPGAAEHFMREINKTGTLKGSGKQAGRLIFKAWDEDQGKAQDAIIYAIQETCYKFNQNYLVMGNYALAAA